MIECKFATLLKHFLLFIFREHLEKLLKEEREERLRQTDEQLIPIRAHLQSIFTKF